MEPLDGPLPAVDYDKRLQFITYRDKLYFNDPGWGASARLWRTDGTRAGTVLVKELPPVPAGFPAFDHYLSVAGDTLYWTPLAPGLGRELWRSDGTPEGTVLAQDIVPGPTGSRPFPLAAMGDALLFSADDGVHGTELWRFDPDARVTGRYVFYNNSAFDALRSLDADDHAIAPDKRPLLPGQPASFANVTSYSRGINGVIVDIAGLPPGEALSPADFGGSKAPASLLVRRGQGVGGSDRVVLYWPDYNPPSAQIGQAVVANGWATVVVKANERTGLAESDAFTFGNVIGESGDASALFAVVNAIDLAAVRPALNSTADLSSRVDFNRDGRVNALDLAAVRSNYLHSLTPPPAAPAPPAQRVAAELLAEDDRAL